MDSNSKQPAIVIGVIVLLGILAVVLWWSLATRTATDSEDQSQTQEPVSGDPVDTALDVFRPLVEELQKTAEGPISYEFPKDNLASDEVVQQINDLLSEGREGLLRDIVCQQSVPNRLRTRLVYELDNKAQVMIMSPDEGLVGQTLVTLEPFEGHWQIATIECGTGEIGPQGEFSFDFEGFLLKDLPEPLNSELWYLVFTQDGEKGRYAPLHFDQNSMCDGAVCNPDGLDKESYVHVQGQMSEIGVTVVRLNQAN